MIDSGSTNNFVQGRISKLLGLQMKAAQSFQVLVGNSEELQCTLFCPQVPIFLGPHMFLVDLFSLPIIGAEIVLGVQWLNTLGPIVTD